jgi:hypothetical protein
MSWDLTTLIDFSGDRFECIKALISFFEPDLRSIQFEVVREINYEDEILDAGDLVWNSSTLSKLVSLFNQYPESADTYRYISVGLGLHGYGDFDYSPYPEISFKSNTQRRGIRAVGQEGDAVLLFGNHKTYKDKNVLPKSGRILDMDLVVQTLKHICQTIQPKNLYLLSEEQIYVPWNYHFIFHNELKGYAQDLADVIQLVLHGGDERYIDGRHGYEVGVSDDFGMTFCRRNRGHIETLQNFMLKYGTQLERKGLPTTFSREYMEESLLDSSSIADEGDSLMDFFFVGEGLGIYAKPLINRYCESIFLSLISGLTDKVDEIPIEVPIQI